MPIAKTNDYFPNRDVPRQLNESDKQAALKEALAGLFNPDKSSPYETLRKMADGSYRIGRYGTSGEQLGSFLSSLGEPPDPALIDKLMKAGRLPKDFAEKLKNPEFLSKLKLFAKKLDGGTEPVTKQELAAFLPKEVQEGLATVLVDQMKAKVGNNPGAIAAGLLSGKAPDKITQADMNSPRAEQLSQAGKRLYEMAEARQQPKSSADAVKWDSAGRMTIGDGKWLEGKAGEALKRAQEQARAAGVDIQINSADRTYQEQSALYARLNGISPVAKPGTSNHESGRALDMQNYEQAKPFLMANGFVHGDGSGPIATDLVHFKYVG